jgi:hypothetical protein
VRRRFLVLLGLAACNRAFGIENTGVHPPDDAALAPDGDPRIDLDRDGVKDVEDPCIAPYTDLMVDSDGDGMPNAGDACPLDTAASGDGDEDGIGDACDPTPDAGDRVRCVMAFTDPELDVAMWHPRDESAAWNVAGPRVLAGRGIGSIRADWSFEAPSVTTISVVGYVYTLGVGSSAVNNRFDVLVRAGGEPSESDVGCSLVSGVSWSLVASDGSSETLGPPPAGVYSSRFKMDVTLVPGASDGRTVRCSARLHDGPVANLDATARLPNGTLAFATDGPGGVTGIVIYERDDAPP